jgi:hypothetical protein
MKNTGSPRFATIHNNDGFENRRPKILKNCANVNTRYDVKQHKRQSEMSVILVSHRSQSGMRLINLLKPSVFFTYHQV